MSSSQYWLLRNWAKLYKQTPAERSLEPAIAKLGVPYRIQHPIWALGYFPDFAILPWRVIIEVDDASHRTKAKQLKDKERTARLTRAGWRVVRCTNEEALTAPDATVSRLLKEAGINLQEK